VDFRTYFQRELLTAFSVVGLGIVRTVYLVRVQSTSIDKSWNGFSVFVSGMAELNIGIMCACAPSTKHFMTRYGHSVTSKISSFTGHSIGARRLVSPGMNGSSGVTDSGISPVEMEVMAEKGIEFDERKYRSTTEHMLSAASSRSPLTSPHPGTSRDIMRPGVMHSYDDDDTHDRYDGRVGTEDWTNSSKLVV